MTDLREYVYPVLVCGGRDYADTAKVYHCLDTLLWLYGDLMIITGAARGADTIAEQWAKSRQQIYVGFCAQWGKYGKSAGTKRNAEMAALSGAKQLVAFHGGRGTLNMISTARNLDEEIVIWLPDGEFWR